MLKNNLKYSLKSTAVILLVLFCCPNVFSFDGDISCMSDTIIVDGKKVKVKREYTYSNSPQPEDTLEKPEKPRKQIDFVFYLGGMVGFGPQAGSRIYSAQDDFSAVAGFANTEFNTNWQTEVGVVAGFSMNKKFGIDLGFRTGSIKLDHQTFAIDQLNDSLVKFQSFEVGNISQLTRRDEGLGVERDTLGVPNLKNEELKLTYFRIPIGVSYTQWNRGRNSAPKWKVQGGVTFCILRQSSQTEVIFMNTDTELEEFDLAKNNLSQNTLAPYLKFGYFFHAASTNGFTIFPEVELFTNHGFLTGEKLQFKEQAGQAQFANILLNISVLYVFQ